MNFAKKRIKAFYILTLLMDGFLLGGILVSIYINTLDVSTGWDRLGLLFEGMFLGSLLGLAGAIYTLLKFSPGILNSILKSSVIFIFLAIFLLVLTNILT